MGLVIIVILFQPQTVCLFNILRNVTIHAIYKTHKLFVSINFTQRLELNLRTCVCLVDGLNSWLKVKLLEFKKLNKSLFIYGVYYFES